MSKNILKQLNWVFATKCHKCGHIEYRVSGSLVNAIGFIIESRKEEIKCNKCKEKCGANLHFMKI